MTTRSLLIQYDPDTVVDDAENYDLASQLEQMFELAEVRAAVLDVEPMPDLLSTLEFLADQWADEFDNDKPINGADFVQWFGEVLRLHIRPAIATAKSA